MSRLKPRPTKPQILSTSCYTRICRCRKHASVSLETSMDRIQRAACKNEQSAVVGAAEQELRRALGNIDCVDQVSRRVINEYLARGDVNVALVIHCEAFPALLREEF